MENIIESRKYSLFNNFVINFPGKKDCINVLMSDLLLKKLFNSKEYDFEFIYQNRKKIHENLYKHEKIINFELNENKEINFKDLFFLDLLINDNRNIVYYTYSKDLIKNINDYQNKMNKPFIKIILSKIILDLIDNYAEKNENDKDNEIKEIEKDNISVILKLQNDFKKYNFDYNLKKIKNKNIDELYAEIINYHLNSEDFDFEYIDNIFKILKLDSIHLTEFMFKEISAKLNSENKFEEINHLFIEKKIIYYYILLKYIYTNSFYIYNLPFFFDIRNIIIKSNKSLDNKIESYNNVFFKDKIEFVIKKLLDSDYYYNKYFKKTDCNNKINNDFKNNAFKNTKLDESICKSILVYFKLSKNGKRLNDSENEVTFFHERKKKESIKHKIAPYNLINIINKYSTDIKNKEKNKKNKEKECDVNVINLLESYCDLKEKCHFIPYNKPKFKENVFFDIKGYEINKDSIFFIENKYDQNEISRVYSHIINKKIYKTIYEIPSIKSISSLKPGKISIKDDIYICPGKLIFDNYKKETEKNIILLIAHNSKEKDYNIYSVYKTEDFKVNSICPIINVQNNFLEETNYFFAAGVNEGSQLVSLYRILYDNNKKIIKNISDIPLSIKEKIISIKQFRETGRILISCSNNKCYLYSSPNLTIKMLFEENDELIEKYEEFYPSQTELELENNIYEFG